MKFEIDDKTEMIEVDSQGFGEYWPAETKNLEQILQAVKKTQVKLVNKQIQDIQDSKHKEINWANPNEAKKTIHDTCERAKKTIIRYNNWTEQQEDARLYSALKHIIQSNLIIPHNLLSKPNDEYDIDYQSRLKVAKLIESEFRKLTRKDIMDILPEGDENCQLG